MLKVAEKRGKTHQGNQRCSSAGVGPGQDGSFGAVTAARSLLAVKLSRALGLGTAGFAGQAEWKWERGRLGLAEAAWCDLYCRQVQATGSWHLSCAS